MYRFTIASLVIVPFCGKYYLKLSCVKAAPEHPIFRKEQYEMKRLHSRERGLGLNYVIDFHPNLSSLLVTGGRRKGSAFQTVSNRHKVQFSLDPFMKQLLNILETSSGKCCVCLFSLAND